MCRYPPACASPRDTAASRFHVVASAHLAMADGGWRKRGRFDCRIWTPRLGTCRYTRPTSGDQRHKVTVGWEHALAAFATRMADDRCRTLECHAEPTSTLPIQDRAGDQQRKIVGCSFLWRRQRRWISVLFMAEASAPR